MQAAHWKCNFETALEPVRIGCESAALLVRADKKAQAFPQFLETRKALVHELPPGAFKESGTGVDSKIVVIAAAN